MATRSVATDRSRDLHDRAHAVFPGGLTTRNHLVPSQQGLVFIDHADGPYLWDVDGKRFIDFWMSHSALLVGHNHPVIRAAIQEQLERGTNFGLATAVQVELGEQLQRRFRSLERVVITDSNTRSVSYAVRLARAFTGRPLIAKMQGGYHGTIDTVFVGVQKPYGEPFGERVTLPGVSVQAASEIILMQWNDVVRCEAVFEEYGDRLAAVICEPVMGDGIIPPAPGFLQFLRDRTRACGALLIYDEAITCGMAQGGAQELYGVYPDLCIVGKSMSGGTPISAFGGRADVMSMTDASGGMPPVPIGTTFPAHPLGCAAGIAELDLLGPAEFEHMARLGRRVRDGVAAIATELKKPVSALVAGHVFALHWNPGPIVTWQDHLRCDERPLKFIRDHLFRSGIYVSAPGRGCVSAAHTDAHVDQLLEAIRDGVIALSEQGIA